MNADCDCALPPCCTAQTLSALICSGPLHCSHQELTAHNACLQIENQGFEDRLLSAEREICSIQSKLTYVFVRGGWGKCAYSLSCPRCTRSFVRKDVLSVVISCGLIESISGDPALLSRHCSLSRFVFLSSPLPPPFLSPSRLLFL